MNKIETLIKNGMKNKGLNRVQLAEKIGVSEGAIRKWEREGIENAKLSNVKKLCDILNLDKLEMLGFKPITSSPEKMTIARKLEDISDPTQLKKIESIIDVLKDSD